MVIRVDEAPTALLTLLFVRDAWGLAPDAALADLDPVPQRGASALPGTASRDEWSARWMTTWERTWVWYEAPGAVGPTPTFPPMWETQYGPDGIDRVALNAWKEAVRGPRPARLEDEPERRCLDALVPAWRAGIESILVVPYRGYYAHRIGSHQLVVSKTTREDPELYARALTSALRNV
ncbi:hypothetical protein [Cellulomonas sp. NTE-D12]|uniref:hypothetical protein n=1 Tax=Cellulomonas sp. NTE-D12 TaxID=2962632 RepID=UPI003081AF40|nr:hypothetical protein CELD12_11200 [Cellulomonas sp. NTE-D12]